MESFQRRESRSACRNLSDPLNNRGVNPILRHSRAVRPDRCTNYLRWSMEIRPIKSEADYEVALKEIETLVGDEADSRKVIA